MVFIFCRIIASFSAQYEWYSVSRYSLFCFIFSVQYTALGRLYCTPCSEDRIIRFLLYLYYEYPNSSQVLIYLHRLSIRKGTFLSQFYLLGDWSTEIKVININWMPNLRGIVPDFAKYSTLHCMVLYIQLLCPLSSATVLSAPHFYKVRVMRPEGPQHEELTICDIPGLTDFLVSQGSFEGQAEIKSSSPRQCSVFLNMNL